MNWYDATEQYIQTDQELLTARHTAYHNTFVVNTDGAPVLFDLENLVASYYSSGSIEPQEAAVVLALEQFIQTIKVRCGMEPSLDLLKKQMEHCVYPTAQSEDTSQKENELEP